MSSSRAVLIVATLLALTVPRALLARDVVAPSLRQAMLEAGPDERLSAYLVLADQLQPSDLAPVVAGQARRARPARVASALKAHARQSQRDVRALLDAAVERGEAELRSVLWVGNAIVFEAEASVIAALAELPGVDRIRAVRRPATSPQDSAPAPLLGSPAGYPFFDDFESGSLAPLWDVNTTGAGYVVVTMDNDPEFSSFHVNMGSSIDNTPSLASMTLELDLSGQTTVGIRFKHKEYGDEDHAEDGVFVSEDGVTFTQVLSLTGSTAKYQTLWVDLDSVLPGLGISYTSTFHVRFQWFDNFPIPADGFAFDDIEIGPGVGGPPIALPEPNIVAQQAPQLWEKGFDGTGILIGSIDSGVVWTHTDLVNRIWNNPGEIPGNSIDDDSNGFVDDVHGWDFENDDNSVVNTDYHGTLTAGLMVGDGNAGRITGMAPGATLVACRVFSETEYWAAQQYLIDTGVDVISSSYSYKWPDQPDYRMFRQITDVELAAGIIHANSIGNQGNQLTLYPVPFNIAAPGNSPSPFDHPDQAPGGRSSVMAVGGISWPDNSLYGPSGRGPAAWEDMTLYDAGWPHAQDPAYYDYPYGGFGGAGPGLVKPDIVAYTNSVMSTDGNGGYGNFSGTSAATPQVGGAMALMLDVQPEALPRHVAAALSLTAIDMGAPGKDSLYGAGRMRTRSAARRLLVLGRFTPNEVVLSQPFTLELFGPADKLVYGFFNAPLVTNLGDFNLPIPFFFFDVFLLNGQGEATLNYAVPNDPILAGVTVWFQYGLEPTDFSWGGGPWLSVPEPLDID